MSKPFVFGFVAGLALLIVAGVGASRLHQNNTEQGKRGAELAEYQQEIGDATPVRVGVLTPKQRFHSKLHNGSGAMWRGRRSAN